VILPRTSNLTSYDVAVEDVFALNLAVRATVPVVHFTVVANPAIFGFVDHAQVFAFLTVEANLTEPPEALTVFVAAPAFARTKPPRQSATLAKINPLLRLIGTS
jgi:hypothetical protein